VRATEQVCSVNTRPPSSRLFRERVPHSLRRRGRVPGEMLNSSRFRRVSRSWQDGPVLDLVVLFLHLLVTIALLAGAGGARSIVAESLLVKHQLLILNRSRKRSPNLRTTDRMVAGLCALFMRRAG
jgi:hypothetical protein